MGVRVARLEDRVGNVKVTGDVRLRYLGSQEKDGKFVNDGTNMRGLDYSKGSQLDVRARLQFNAKVNDRTDVVVRTTTGNMELGDSFQTSSSGSSLRDRPINIHFDRAYVNHKFGERVSVKAASVSNGTAWSAGLGYGDYKISKRGTWDVKSQYFNFGDNIALQSSRWEVPYDATNCYYDPNFHGGLAYVTSYRGYRGWLATAHYALQDNVGVTGYYGFNNKTNKSIGDNDKFPNYYRVDLNYQF